MFSFFRCVLPAEVPRPTHPNLFFAAEFSVKVLVTVKRVVDYNVKVHAKADKSGPDIEAAKMSMNPFDEIAVEAAVRLKETGAADEVVALTVGPAKAVDQLRTAMAMGADRAIHVTLEAAADPAAAARIIAAVAKNEAPDLILMGKQAIDDDSAQASAMVSAILNLPFAACADALRVENGTAFVRRETDEGLMEVSAALPCVVSADLRLAEPRYVTLPNMMKARKKPVETIDAASLGVDLTPSVTVIEAEDPAARAAGQMLASVDELIDVLKNKAKVL